MKRILGQMSCQVVLGIVAQLASLDHEFMAHIDHQKGERKHREHTDHAAVEAIS